MARLTNDLPRAKRRPGITSSQWPRGLVAVRRRSHRRRLRLVRRFSISLRLTPPENRLAPRFLRPTHHRPHHAMKWLRVSSDNGKVPRLPTAQSEFAVPLVGGLQIRQYESKRRYCPPNLGMTSSVAARESGRRIAGLGAGQGTSKARRSLPIVDPKNAQHQNGTPPNPIAIRFHPSLLDGRSPVDFRNHQGVVVSRDRSHSISMTHVVRRRTPLLDRNLPAPKRIRRN